MIFADLHRPLEPDERIVVGDEFKMADLPDDHWAPVDKFVGHRPREFSRPFHERVLFRRLIAHGVQA